MSRILMAKLAALANKMDANGMRNHADVIDIAIFAAQNGNPETSIDILESMAGIPDKSAGIFDVFRDQQALVDNLTSMLAARAQYPLSFYSTETRKIVNALEKALGRIKLPNGQTALDGMRGYVDSIDSALRGEERDRNKALETARAASGEIKSFVQDPEAYAEEAKRKKWTQRQEEAQRMRAEETGLREEELRAREKAQAGEVTEWIRSWEEEASRFSDEDEELIAEWLAEGWKETQIKGSLQIAEMPTDLERSRAIQEYRKLVDNIGDRVSAWRNYYAMLGEEGTGWSQKVAQELSSSLFSPDRVTEIMEREGLIEEEFIEAPEIEEEAPASPAVPAAQPLAEEAAAPKTDIVSSLPKIIETLEGFGMLEPGKIPAGEAPQQYTKKDLYNEIKGLMEGGVISYGADSAKSTKLVMDTFEDLGLKLEGCIDCGPIFEEGKRVTQVQESEPAAPYREPTPEGIGRSFEASSRHATLLIPRPPENS